MQRGRTQDRLLDNPRKVVRLNGPGAKENLSGRLQPTGDLEGMSAYPLDSADAASHTRLSGFPLARTSVRVRGFPLARTSARVRGFPLARTSTRVRGFPLARTSARVRGFPLARTGGRLSARPLQIKEHAHLPSKRPTPCPSPVLPASERHSPWALAATAARSCAATSRRTPTFFRRNLSVSHRQLFSPSFLSSFLLSHFSYSNPYLVRTNP